MPKKLTKETAQTAVAGGPRPRGRPATLSHQIIIDATLEVLRNRNTDELAMSEVASMLGVATMSLYKYFPNREGLLTAVADYAFSFLELPGGGDWRGYLHAWLWAVQRHADGYPVVRKVMAWSGRVPNAWVRICAPVLVLLESQGLKGNELAFAYNWFLSSATGLMMVESVAPSYRSSLSISQLEGLSADEQRAYLSVFPVLQSDREAILEFGFEQIISGIDALLSRSSK
ncbi:TetR/AcrR family transcriptional regulator [Paraburkholderia sacchari]|uniref:TetR/AcrR family transcriptional regulator n=1 Tax=Paraburkholderia sacchari TaxID=159450 RepID=A0A8T6ZJD3_9BURK|nr:TetR/AcrR family transcriptional regulator [Paraburkholderia sacchari]NLP64906.1 TetR/AcrR family transcriptional regulator [Paraburkholderia sacchari]